jgi:hypothetical protein
VDVPNSIVRIQGGLGNQLFQWFFARWLQDQGTGVDVDYTSISRFHDRVGLTQLDLPPLANIRDYSPPFPHSQKTARVVHFLRRKYLAGTRLPVDEELVMRAIDRGDCISAKPGTLFDGFYQSERLVNEVLKTDPSILPLRLLNASNLHSNLLRKIGISPSISMHIRRGDFGNVNGILGAAYYQQALNELDLENPLELFVFTDSPHDAQDLCDQIATPHRINHIEPGLTAAETLDLMSSSLFFIGSNSTLSWWAAKNSIGEVILPDNFHPNHKKNSSLLNQRLRIEGVHTTRSNFLI